jgi:hypothetical protein
VNDVERDLIIMGKRCSPGKEQRARPEPLGQLQNCFNLMQSLMQCRQDPIHWQLVKVRDKYSMLHLDVLLLIYHFAKVCAGSIVEIGAFVGGSTIAAAWGVRDSGKQKGLIAVESGGSVKHKRLGTKNIFLDLQRNLARYGVTNMVSLINGRSSNPAINSAVRDALGPETIGLFILDADGAVRRDIDCYRNKLTEGCWMVIDDYAGPASNVKVTTTRTDVDALVAAGCLEPLGFYGWSTWVGRWRGALDLAGIAKIRLGKVSGLASKIESI